jgi:hypothetical protein
MLCRTWPYGTRKQVQVLSVEFVRHARVLACAELDGEREGFVLIADGGDSAVEGDVGVIEFCRGGPNGAFWQYRAASRFAVV